MLTRRRILGAAGTAAALPLYAAEADWLVCQIGPFTGIPVPDASQLNEGMRAAFGQINSRGGINGRRVALFEVDDTYTADGFVRAFREAMARRPAALLSPVGSVAIKRMLDDRLLDDHDVVVINAVPGAEALRNPGHAKFFHVRAGDRAQIEKLVQNATTLGITTLAVMHQNIPIGTSGKAMAQDVGARFGRLQLTPYEATVEPASIAATAQKVSGGAPHAVLVLGAPSFTVDSIAALRQAGFGRFVFALSYVPTGLLAKVAGPGARGVALAQTYPNPNGQALPLQREFQTAMRAQSPNSETYTSFHLEGYLTARVFLEGARRTRDAGSAALARALRAMGEVDFGGFRVDFSAGNVGSRFVDIGVVNAAGRLAY